jgi:hypothetical protein
VRRRSIAVTCVLSLAAVTLATGAVAAPGSSPSCAHLISDPHGDAQMWFVPTKPYNPEADLLYLDARTTASTIDLTATMASVNPTPTTGTTVIIYFTTDDQGRSGDWDVSITHAVDGTSFGLQNNNTQAVKALTGSVNPKAGTYTVRVPRKAIDSAFRGAVLRSLGVIVSQDVGVTLAQTGFIEQSTGPDHHYRVGYPYACSHSA